MDMTVDSLSCLLAAAQPIGWWPLLLLFILLVSSAFFSGSETAFFNLPRRQVRKFSKSTVRLERLTAWALTDSNRLLTALLFGNMMVNVLFFAVSSTLSIRVGQHVGPAYGTAVAIICFFMILLGGEMLPKSIAYSNSRRFCLLASPACYLLMRTLGPFLKIMDFLLIGPVVRLFVQAGPSKAISVNQLRAVLDASRRNGLITRDENQLLDEILKFSVLKTRHVMQPRVEMPACPIDALIEDVKQKMLKHKIVKIPVYTKSIDSVVGVIHFRDLLLYPDRTLSSMLRSVPFVPEQKTVESLIEFFKQNKTACAIVVDEYGGIAGWVELEDVIEQLLGTTEDLTGREPIEQIGPMQYRLLADLAIHDWGQAFGIDIDQQRLATLGGFVMARLGKIPKAGETMVFKNMKFTVEAVENNRIQSVILSLDAIGRNGDGEAGN